MSRTIRRKTITRAKALRLQLGLSALVALAMLVAARVAAPYVIFDTSRPAQNETRAFAPDGQTRVAYGPRPRPIFCLPVSHSMYYTGREWPFRYFGSFCRAWLSENGYETAYWDE